MSAEKSTEAAGDQQISKKLVRSQFKDVMVKVDEDIYYLDRLQLALKSGYFEKLFIEDYRDRANDLIEIPLMDTDTFSAVVDIIYGEEMKSVLNSDNFVNLLMAMDYLQMDIDSEICKTLVNAQLNNYGRRSLNNDVFKLYNFIADDTNYEYLLPVVFEHLGTYLKQLQNHDELVSIKYVHFHQVIAYRKFFRGAVTEAYSPLRMISRICARWICHDMESRLHHTLGLVNAARFRFYASDMISSEDFNLSVPTSNSHLNENSISSHIYKWLTYCGDIHRSNPVAVNAEEKSANKNRKGEDGEGEYRFTKLFNREIHFEFSREPKLEMFLKTNNLYDITVKVGEKIYKLHRAVLRSESLYFEEIFSKEYSDLVAQHEGIPNLPSKDEIYSIDEIDSETFDMIVDHMYLGKIEPASDVIFRLLRTIHLLRIDSLKEPCRWRLQTNSEDMCAKDVVEVLNFTHEKTEYADLNRFFLSKYIVDSWPKIDNLPQFADLFKAIVLPAGADSCENGAYLFDKVDQETFKFIIKYIYFHQNTNADGLNEDNLARVLKASDMFKIEKLIEECEQRLLWWKGDMSDADIREILRFTLENFDRYEVLNTVYLVEHMKHWPEVDIELFCTIPYDCLENMLTSNDLYFKDPRDLLDICSKWVVHDVENRYHLIPQIALAIGRNRIANSEDYSIANPSDWKECSQDYVKDKLWKVLSSTSVLASTAALSENEAKQRKTEQPVFIASYEGRSFRFFNADWDEIFSFRLCEYLPDESNSAFYITRYPMSAAIIDDNLFVLCCMLKSTFFHVYNLSSKRLISLASDPRIYENNDEYICNVPLKFTLLNCRKEIYCCVEDGFVLKYLHQWNRWMRISASERDKKEISFASDGNKLYRMYEATRADDIVQYTVEVHDFQQNSWASTPDLPSLNASFNSYSDSKENKILEFVFFNGHGLAVLFRRRLYILDQEARIWRNIRSLPYEYVSVVEEIDIINQNEADEMLYVHVNKLFKFSSTDETWLMKKEWPFPAKTSLLQTNVLPPYGNIIGIHNPKNSI